MNLGRTVILIGLFLVLIGVLINFADRLPIRFGRLPGDLIWRGKNTTFYFPLATSLLLSVVLSFVLWLVSRR
jgi:hypothetical protein